MSDKQAEMITEEIRRLCARLAPDIPHELIGEGLMHYGAGLLADHSGDDETLDLAMEVVDFFQGAASRKAEAATAGPSPTPTAPVAGRRQPLRRPGAA